MDRLVEHGYGFAKRVAHAESLFSPVLLALGTALVGNDVLWRALPILLSNTIDMLFYSADSPCDSLHRPSNALISSETAVSKDNRESSTSSASLRLQHNWKLVENELREHTQLTKINHLRDRLSSEHCVYVLRTCSNLAVCMAWRALCILTPKDYHTPTPRALLAGLFACVIWYVLIMSHRIVSHLSSNQN